MAPRHSGHRLIMHTQYRHTSLWRHGSRIVSLGFEKQMVHSLLFCPSPLVQ